MAGGRLKGTDAAPASHSGEAQSTIAELRQALAEESECRLRAEAALRLSDDRYDVLTGELDVGVIIQGPTAEILLCNPRAKELLGLTMEQLLGRTSLDPAWNVVHEDASPFPGPTHPVPTAIATRAAVRDVVMGVFRPTTEERVWLLVNAYPKLDADGEVRQVVCTFEDITARKRAEANRRASEATLSAALASMTDAVLVTDAAGHVVHMNDAFARFHRFRDVEELRERLGEYRTLVEFRTAGGELQPRERWAVPRALGGEVATNEACHLRRSDTGETWIGSQSFGPIVDATGTVVGAVVVGRDVTEQKHTEDALRAADERFAALLENAPLAVIEWSSADLRIERWSDGATRLFGWSAEEAIGRRVDELDWTCPGERPLAEGAVASLLDGAAQRNVLRIRNLRKDGATVHCEWHNSALLGTESGASVLSLVLDVTGRARAEESYQTLFREMLDGVALHEIVCDDAGRPVDYRFLAVNPSFERMTGLAADRVVGKRVTEALPGVEGRWIDAYGKVALTGEPALFDSFSADLDKHFRVTAFRPAPGQFVCIFQDMTEEKRASKRRAELEEQLHQSQKMESVGRLAGGVAHDFNNMLGVIIGHVEMSLADVDDQGTLHADLLAIKLAAERSADLTRQLLAFARKQAVVPKVLDLDAAVGGTLKMLSRLIGENIRLEQRRTSNLWPVRVDPSQIDQLLANLCVNARDAISGSGHVTMTLSNRTLSASDCAALLDVVPGDYVRLAITDDGSGMDAETKERVFEPFFTTKEHGRGTGLGLATVYGIVKQNGGFIEVESEVGHGTTFGLHLPRHIGDLEPARAATVEAARGHETILLVEDEAAILKVTTRILAKLGYVVLAVGTPNEALRTAREHQGAIDLLLTDVMMPEMNGRELAMELRGLRPGMRLLFMSGYTADVIAHHGITEQAVALVRKPFSRAELAASVRAVLDA
jgi:PAS domain S-box-containing protein